MRVWAAMRTDALLQARNQLYAISIGVSLLSAGALAWLSPHDQLAGTVPLTLLAFAGGSTLLYVVAMVLLERADGTLSAVVVSPLRSWEYLASKVATLTFLAFLEGALIAGGGILLLSRTGAVPTPNLGLLALGLVALGVMHVLVGIVLVVRFERLLDALLPMSLIATALQLPAAFFVGAVESPALLAIPSAMPTMLIRGAFVPLEPWEWAYAIGGTVVVCVLLGGWALRAFERHVVGRGR